MDTNEAKKSETLEEIINEDRYYEAIIDFIETKKLSWRNKLESKPSGSLMDDMGKLAQANSSVLVLNRLTTSLSAKRKGK